MQQIKPDLIESISLLNKDAKVNNNYKNNNNNSLAARYCTAIKAINSCRVLPKK